MFQRTIPVLLAAAVSFAACSGTPKVDAPAPAPAAAAQDAPAKAPPTDAPKPAPAAPLSVETVQVTPAPAVADKAYVRMTTSKGDIVIELDRAKAPVSVDNFLKYVKKGQYDGTVFHRVIGSFMIQGGGFDKTMTEKPTDAPIKNEGTNGLSNARGTIAMARTSDPNSATAQFYINVVDNKMLDTRPGRPGYAVFGHVVDGMQVVDQIRAVPTGQKMANSRGGKGMMGDVPLETVEIVKVVEIPAPATTAPAAK